LGTKGDVSPESDAAAGGNCLDTLGRSHEKVNFAAAARYNPNAEGKTTRGVDGRPNPNDTGDHCNAIVALPSDVIADTSDSSGADDSNSATAPGIASEDGEDSNGSDGSDEWDNNGWTAGGAGTKKRTVRCGGRSSPSGGASYGSKSATTKSGSGGSKSDKSSSRGGGSVDA